MRTKMKQAMSVVALLCLVAIFGAIYFLSEPKTDMAEKCISVEVVHKDGTAKRFTYETSAEYLGDVLQSEDLIQGDEGEFGMYIKVVDGERAIYEEDGAYWAFYQGEEYAVQSVDLTPIYDGDTFKLVYTYG